MNHTEAIPSSFFRYQGRTIAEWLPVIVDRIAQRFDPEQVILFGSLATGEAGPDSDIDLLVVFRGVDDKRATAVAMRRAISDVPAPVDLIVTDEAEVARRGGIIGPALGTALRDGRTMYARGN